MKLKALLIPFKLCLIAALAGCATNHAYRSVSVEIPSNCEDIYEAVRDSKSDRTYHQKVADQIDRIRHDLKETDRNACWRSAWEKHKDYDLHFLEFDDQGWQVDVDRANPQADTEISKLMQHLNDLSEARQPLSIIVYTHGWHHTAAPDDDNVVEFRELLEQASAMEAKLCKSKLRAGGCSEDKRADPMQKKRRVVGIYVGWRGDSILGPIIKYGSVWDRKLAAEKVALGSVQEFYALMHDYFLKHFCHSGDQADDRRRCANTADVRMLTIGHSFGGLITYRGLQTRLIAGVNETYRARPENSVPSAYGYGDLTVLINPAFEGTRFEALAWAAMHRNYPDSQLPILLVAQSKGDWATNWTFPIFRRLTTLFETINDSAESQGNVHTVGWTDRYLTHDLSYVQGSVPCPNESNNDQPNTFYKELERTTRQQQSDHSEFGNQTTLKLCDGLELKNVMTSDALLKKLNQPLWVIRADKTVIKDHDDFMNPHFVDFVRQVYFSVLEQGDARMMQAF